MKAKVLAGVVLAALLSLIVRGAGVIISWTPGDKIVPPTTGFRIYRGPSPGAYVEVWDAGKVTNYAINVLPKGTNFFVVTAYDDLGLESEPSREALWIEGAPQPPSGLSIRAVLP